MKNILVVNGSLHGNLGNCQKIVDHIIKQTKELKISSIDLLNSSKEKIESELNSADAFIFISGTYWESWGSPLQKFFEDFTYLETTSTFMGKPAGCVVLSHSTGGRGVLSRILVNLNLFGCILPPLSGLEISFVGQEALTYSKDHSLKEDIWSIKDIDLLIKNIGSCLDKSYSFESWPIDTGDFKKVWFKNKSIK